MRKRHPVSLRSKWWHLVYSARERSFVSIGRVWWGQRSKMWHSMEPLQLKLKFPPSRTRPLNLKLGEHVNSVWIDDMEIRVAGKLIKTARLTEEWYRDVEDPSSLIVRVKEELRRNRVSADIFTFWQRLPEINPKYDYYTESDSIAAIPLKSFNYWWEQQINPKVRNMIRKAEKNGVEVKVVEYSNEFVEGVTKIFNESPVRQGRKFLHYGKDFETVKQEFARNLFRESLIAAYYMNELIGFIMLADAGKYAITTQIISSLRHRDKSPNNALLAKAVQICDERKFPYLVYARWLSGTLGDFKRHNGFERIDLPRYYIPLSIKGMLALRARLHHGAKGILPGKVLDVSRALRGKWYARKSAALKTTFK